MEAEILRMQEQLELMKKKYNEAVSGSETNEQNENDNDLKSIESTERNMMDKGNVEADKTDDQANIETVDPDAMLPDTLETRKELISPEHNEDTRNTSQLKNEHPTSSTSQSVVQESEPEMFNTPKKESLSQRSKLSLNGRKKRKRSACDLDQEPACTSTPKALTQDSVRSATSVDSSVSPVKSPSPPPSCNGQGENFKLCKHVIVFIPYVNIIT